MAISTHEMPCFPPLVPHGIAVYLAWGFGSLWGWPPPQTRFSPDGRRVSMGSRRGFGEVERRVSKAGSVAYRARFAMPDGTRYSRTFTTKLDAEAWLAA